MIGIAREMISAQGESQSGVPTAGCQVLAASWGRTSWGPNSPGVRTSPGEGTNEALRDHSPRDSRPGALPSDQRRVKQGV